MTDFEWSLVGADCVATGDNDDLHSWHNIKKLSQIIILR